jgi:CheY-like chemotaxis protein
MAKPAILVVEDDIDILRLITYNLESSGFNVGTAQDGYEALTSARRRVPELVILDLMLPGLDGLEVCKELKRSEATRKIPVLMLTARGEEVDRIVGLELGADDYVVKPFSPRELILRVRAILKRYMAEEAPATVWRREGWSLMGAGRFRPSTMPSPISWPACVNSSGGGLSRNGNTATFAVTDEGPGIPLFAQERVFERFYRVEKDRSEASGSTGLGLAICRHIILNQGGKIWVESPPAGKSKGSAFKFTLARAEER